MGQLVVGLGGAALSSAFGFSPALGFSAGTFLGGLLFPPDPVRIEGPRREDLRVSSSTYGRPIPEGFGTLRLPGNMIWSSGIREVQTTQELGGKGSLAGPTTEQVSYNYFVDAAFAFAQGPAEAILRVWADGKVIYDARDPNTTSAIITATTKPGVTIRTYLGTETQLRCPTIEAAEGTDNTSAYRGTVYLTLENFHLADFGNRIPQITAEIAFKASTGNSGRLSSASALPWAGTTAIVRIDWKRDRLYAIDDSNDGNPDGETSGIRVFSLSTMQELYQQPWDDVGGDFAGSTLGGTVEWGHGRWTGYLFFQHPGGNQERFQLIEPDALTVAGTFGATGPVPGLGEHGGPDNISASEKYNECLILAPPVPGLEVTEQRLVMMFSNLQERFAVLDWTNPADIKIVCWGGTPTAEFQGVVGCIANPPSAGGNRFWVLHQDGSGAEAFLKSYRFDFGTHYDAEANACVGGPFVFPETSFDVTQQGGANRLVGGPAYDDTDGNLIFWAAESTTIKRVWKWDVVSNQIRWTLDLTANVGAPFSQTYIQNSRIRNGKIGFIGFAPDLSDYVMIDTIAGTILDSGLVDDTFNDWRVTDQEYAWDDTRQCFWGSRENFGGQEFNEFCVGRATGLGEALSDVVALLSGDVDSNGNIIVNGAGLATSEYNVDDLNADTVRGYAVSRRMTAAKAIEPLMTAFDFDGTLADDQVVFVKRGGASVATITQADLVDAEQLVQETRIQEVELPERIDLGFMDIAMDYQENVATAKRPRAPVPTMFSLDFQTIDLAIVFTRAEAKEIAERLLFTAWSQRVRLSFSLTDEFLRLVPTDVITLTLDSGSSFELRITKVDVRKNTQRYEATVQDFTLQAPSNVVADSLLGFEEDTLPTSGATRLCLIDAPYLRDIDAVSRTAIELKFAMAGFSSGWQAGALWESDDGLTYEPVARSLAPKTYGIATTALPAGPENLTDETTTITVAMVEGELSSVSDAAFLANDSVAIIGNPVLQNWEYVAFRDAVQNANGTYAVSHLMRGRRGTDAPEITDSHGKAELFILAERAAIDRILLPLAQHNVTRFYRGVGRDDFLENSETVPLSSKARPLMPFRPYHLTAVVDGSDNIDFAWKRSDRLNFELTNSGSWNDSQLNEDSLSFEVDILDAPGGAVVNTYPVSTEAFEYTKAQIKADLAVGTGATTLDVGSTTTFTRAAGSFVTDGFVAGMTIETAGFTDGANNGVFTLASVGALTLTIEEATLVAESGGGDEAIDAIREADVTFVVYQISAQVQRGFASEEKTITL